MNSNPFLQSHAAADASLASTVAEREQAAALFWQRSGFTQLLGNERATVALRNATIAERDATIAERDATIAQREATIAQHEATIAQHDATIAQREATIVQNEATIAQNEATIAQHEATIAQLQGPFPPMLAAGGGQVAVSVVRVGLRPTMCSYWGNPSTRHSHKVWQLHYPHHLFLAVARQMRRFLPSLRSGKDQGCGVQALRGLRRCGLFALQPQRLLQKRRPVPPVQDKALHRTSGPTRALHQVTVVHMYKYCLGMSTSMYKQSTRYDGRA